MSEPVIHKRVGYEHSIGFWGCYSDAYWTACGLEVAPRWTKRQWRSVTCKNCLRTRKQK